MLHNCIWPCLYFLLFSVEIRLFLPPQTLATCQNVHIVLWSPPPSLVGHQESLPASSLSFLSLAAQPEPTVKSHLFSKSQFLPNSFTST